MQKLTIISGPQGSGKSRLANALTSRVKTVTIRDFKHSKIREALESDPDVFILEEANISVIERITRYINNQIIPHPEGSIQQQNKNFPKVIACTQQIITRKKINGVPIEIINLNT